MDVSAAAYDAGHMPGASLWTIYRDLKDADYRLVDKAVIEALLGRSGISADSTVIFYGYAPAMGLWLLKLYGHAGARILDTSRTAWQQAGRPWTEERAVPA